MEMSLKVKGFIIVADVEEEGVRHFLARGKEDPTVKTNPSELVWYDVGIEEAYLFQDVDEAKQIVDMLLSLPKIATPDRLPLSDDPEWTPSPYMTHPTPLHQVALVNPTCAWLEAECRFTIQPIVEPVYKVNYAHDPMDDASMVQAIAELTATNRPLFTS